jgi:ribosomal protein L7/L12
MIPPMDKELGIEQLKSLSLLEAAELVKQIKEAFSFSVASSISDSEAAAIIGASKRATLKQAEIEEQEIDSIIEEIKLSDFRIQSDQREIDILKMETKIMIANLTSLIK